MPQARAGAGSLEKGFSHLGHVISGVASIVVSETAPRASPYVLQGVQGEAAMKDGEGFEARLERSVKHATRYLEGRSKTVEVTPCVMCKGVRGEMDGPLERARAPAIIESSSCADPLDVCSIASQTDGTDSVEVESVASHTDCTEPPDGLDHTDFIVVDSGGATPDRTPGSQGKLPSDSSGRSKNGRRDDLVLSGTADDPDALLAAPLRQVFQQRVPGKLIGQGSCPGAVPSFSIYQNQLKPEETEPYIVPFEVAAQLVSMAGVYPIPLRDDCRDGDETEMPGVGTSHTTPKSGEFLLAVPKFAPEAFGEPPTHALHLERSLDPRSTRSPTPEMVIPGPSSPLDWEPGSSPATGRYGAPRNPAATSAFRSVEQMIRGGTFYEYSQVSGSGLHTEWWTPPRCSRSKPQAAPDGSQASESPNDMRRTGRSFKPDRMASPLCDLPLPVTGHALPPAAASSGFFTPCDRFPSHLVPASEGAVPVSDWPTRHSGRVVKKTAGDDTFGGHDENPGPMTPNDSPTLSPSSSSEPSSGPDWSQASESPNSRHTEKNFASLPIRPPRTPCRVRLPVAEPAPPPTAPTSRPFHPQGQYSAQPARGHTGTVSGSYLVSRSFSGVQETVGGGTSGRHHQESGLGLAPKHYSPASTPLPPSELPAAPAGSTTSRSRNSSRRADRSNGSGSVPLPPRNVLSPISGSAPPPPTTSASATFFPWGHPVYPAAKPMSDVSGNRPLTVAFNSVEQTTASVDTSCGHPQGPPAPLESCAGPGGSKTWGSLDEAQPTGWNRNLRPMAPPSRVHFPAPRHAAMAVAPPGPFVSWGHDRAYPVVGPAGVVSGTFPASVPSGKLEEPVVGGNVFHTPSPAPGPATQHGSPALLPPSPFAEADGLQTWRSPSDAQYTGWGCRPRPIMMPPQPPPLQCNVHTSVAAPPGPVEQISGGDVFFGHSQARGIAPPRYDLSLFSPPSSGFGGGSGNFRSPGSEPNASRNRTQVRCVAKSSGNYTAHQRRASRQRR